MANSHLMQLESTAESSQVDVVNVNWPLEDIWPMISAYKNVYQAKKQSVAMLTNRDLICKTS